MLLQDQFGRRPMGGARSGFPARSVNRYDRGNLARVTVDTSRVAVAITRNRLMTECVFPYFTLQDQEAGPKGGFVLPA